MNNTTSTENPQDKKPQEPQTTSEKTIIVRTEANFSHMDPFQLPPNWTGWKS